MKKIISLILCLSICLCLIPKVYAEEYDYVRVKIDAGQGVLTEIAIVQNDDLYLPAAFYSQITRFTYYKDSQIYLIDGQEYEKAFKSIKVDSSSNLLLISSGRSVTLSEIFEVNGELYLPLSTLLPVLNAEVVEIKNGIIYVSNNELSLGELLYDFDISEYAFDYATEFADREWIGKLFYELPNWLLDSITDWRWDRLDIVFKTGDYNDFVDIFTEYLQDDEVYLKAMSGGENSTAELLEIIGITQYLNSL